MKNKKCRFCKLLFVFIFIVPEISFAQFQDMKFEYLTSDIGLSNNRIRSILRDTEGYLWLGTEMGLNRYDGNKIRIFENNSDENSLSDNNIYSIYEDQHNQLWIGTRNGLNLFDRNTETFKRFTFNPADNTSISNNFIRAIIEDQQGNLWFSAGSSLCKWNSVKENFIRIPLPQKTNNEPLTICAICKDLNENLWLCTEGNKIWRFNTETLQFDGFTNDLISINSSGEKKILTDSSGIVWIGSKGNGLFSYNPTTKEFQHYGKGLNGLGTSGDDIWDMCLDGNRYLLLALDHGGINRFDLQSKTFEYCTSDELKENGLNSDAIWSVYKDKEGILYAGTSTSGLNIHNPKKERFTTFKHKLVDQNSLIFDVVYRFFEDSYGLIWIGTDGGGVSVFNPKDKTFKNYQFSPADAFSISGNAVLAITEDKNHDMWLGTWGAGLNKFERKTGKFHHFMPNDNDSAAISEKYVCDLLTDDSGKIWITYRDVKLDLFDIQHGVEKKYREETFSPTMPNYEYQNFITRQSDGNIGFSIGREYYILDSKTYNLQAVKLPGNFVFHDILLDRSGNYWIATSSEGLYIMKPDGTVEKHDKSNGFLTNSLCKIFEDNQGNIWISSFSGLIEYLIDEKKFRYFTSADGLQSNKFSNWAGLKAKDGTLYFGGFKGFNSFRPEEINVNPVIPPVYIDEFQLFNKQVTYNTPNSPLKQAITATNEIVLSYDQSIFSFGFSAINFTYPEKANYAYKMEGYEKDWNFTNSSRRYATYTNLDPGTYTFMVKASNNDAIWNEKPKSIQITILPPFWKTWWAYLLYLSGIIVSLAFIRRASIIKEQRKIKLAIERRENAQAMEFERMKFNRTIEFEKKEHELDQMKLKFFTNISHEFRTPLTLILGPLNHFFDHKTELNWEKNERYFILIKRNSEKLLYLINKVLDIRKLDSGLMKIVLKKGDIIQFTKSLTDSFIFKAEHKNIKFTTILSHSKFNAWFDSDVLDKIVFNLLSNAFKFTPNNGEIVLEVEIIEEESEKWKNEQQLKTMNHSGDIVKILVRDTGIGIQEKQKEKIFDRFYQAENTSISSGGSGIGLNLVKELVELLKGKLELESEVGKGSCFILWLPLEKKSEENADNFDIVQDLETAKQLDIENLQTQKLQNENDQSELPELTEKPMILIVEDNQDMEEYISGILNTSYHIALANNGKQGLERAFENIPDLIVSDIMMPEMDGIEMSKILRNDERTSHIPIILLTARTTEEFQIEGLETGVDDYLTKPFSAKILLLKVSNLIKSRRLLREKFSFSDIYKDVSPASALTVNILEDKFIQKAKAIVEKHICNTDFDPQIFAQEIGMSRTQLYRKLKAVTNQSVIDFIFAIKINNAVIIFQSENKNISEVAFEVGFKDTAHFSKVFSKHLGMSPSKYISNLKNTKKP